jgi:hypothetical protein
MKLQVLNGSLGKVVLAAATIAFMISLASPAQAQQGQWGADNCFYAPAQGQMVRQGCMLQVNGNQYYYDIRTSVVTDLRTRSSFRLAQQNGRLYVNAGSGWADAGPAPAVLQAPNQRAQASPLKPGEIAPNVRENIPQNAMDQTPEERAWVQRSNENMINGMVLSANRSNCELRGEYYDTQLGPRKKACL